MNLFPAIDLVGGKVVRLYKGDYARMTVYNDHPLEVAEDFERCGAKYIHMVDLEGARDGGTPNLSTVRDVARHTGLFVEVGGGIRSMDTVRTYLDAGIDRVILGTAAVKDPAFLKEAVDTYGSQIAVGADIRDGYVSIKGWTEQSGYTLEAFCREMQELGVKTLICTDISRDGAMRGTNRELYRRLSETYTMDITASGGVSTLDDVRALAAMDLYGCIIGKAYYTGDIKLPEALAIAGKQV
ncbi:MAG: 1-(5-phosphoribosyl)-5-[Clostridia bacterium]|nr:1-(5-phosphoribosyl)-5-[(5-phosphoribosylamino)methylideneamino]imidazole-4-carboxamide isomerase [Clostridia bacterium]